MSDLQRGALLQGGKYKIEKSLGQGGFGITYLAEQTNLGRKVCIKEFFMKEYGERTESSDADSDATVLTGVSAVTSAAAEIMGRYREKFVKEARTIARLDHPGIVRIHDVFEENGTAYYVMDFIEGENLNDMVKREGALSEERALGYIRQVADALSYVHGNNIMHLDVKPANIIVRKSDDKAILIDFGTAKQYDSEGTQTSTTPIGLSAGYAPIEMTKPGGVQTFSPETDVYSLGATLYYLVTGQNPPDASERMEMLIEGESLIFPTKISAVVSSAIENALQSRKMRPRSAEEFLLSLNCSNGIPFGADSCNDEKMPEVSEFMPKASDAERKKVKDKYEKAAVYGDPYAQYSLGECFISGWGVEKDDKEAVKWYRKAAEQGLAIAQQSLGVCYSLGAGVERDESEAVEWFKKAAEQGLADAKASLGDRILQGKGIDRDAKEAIKWLKEAASQGSVHAQARLGDCYRIGDGVEKDEKESYKWYKTAAENGDQRAKSYLQESQDAAKLEVRSRSATGFENGHEWVDLGLPSGLLWATCNIGAYSPEDYGGYFAFGEIGVKSGPYDAMNYKWVKGLGYSKYCFADKLPILLPEDDAATNLWGKPWRIPTQEEIEELIHYCSWGTFEEKAKVVGPSGNSILLPAAGFIGGFSGKKKCNIGQEGRYWSANSIIDWYMSCFASLLLFSDKKKIVTAGNREYGLSIRPVMNCLR